MRTTPRQQPGGQSGGKQAPSAPSAREKLLARREQALRAQATGRYYVQAGHRATRGVQAQVGPVAAVGLLTLASATLSAAKTAGAADAQILGGTAATCIVIAVVAAHRFRWRIADRKALLRAQLFVAVSAGWLIETTAYGLTWNATAVLAVLGAALSLHWWRRRRIPNTVPSPPAPEPRLPEPDPEVDPYAQMWETNLASGDWAGTRLESREEIKAGWRYILRLVPGKQTYGTALGILERIRSGLDLRPGEDLIIERHPVLPASCLLLTIVTRSPIKDSVLWPGPEAFEPGTGCVRLGPYTDGEGVARWRVYTDNSLWGGILIGGTGSGKSRMLESIAMSVAASESHPTVVWFADGDGGASSTLLARHADHVGLDEEFEQAREMLAGALLIMKLRRAENVVNSWEGFTPTAERPGILIFIDECHLLFADEGLRAMAAEIARRGRKVGVAIVAATQVATLDAFGGAGNAHSDALRSSLRAGNGVVLRTNTNTVKDVFRIELDPGQFPAMPGYAYYIAAKGSAERTAPLRGYYVTDELKNVWPDRITWRSLSVEEGNVYGEEYTRRGEIAEQTREEALAWITAVKAGRGLGVRERLQRQPLREEGPVFAVAQIPVWNPEEFAPAGPTRGRDELHATHVRVLAALELGAQKPKEIAEGVGVGERQVNNLLNELIDEFGLVRKADYGKYELADQEPADA